MDDRYIDDLHADDVYAVPASIDAGSTHEENLR